MKLLILLAWLVLELLTLAWWSVFARNPNNTRRP